MNSQDKPVISRTVTVTLTAEQFAYIEPAAKAHHATVGEVLLALAFGKLNMSPCSEAELAECLWGWVGGPYPVSDINEPEWREQGFGVKEEDAS